MDMRKVKRLFEIGVRYGNPGTEKEQEPRATGSVADESFVVEAENLQEAIDMVLANDGDTFFESKDCEPVFRPILVKANSVGIPGGIFVRNVSVSND